MANTESEEFWPQDEEANVVYVNPLQVGDKIEVSSYGKIYEGVILSIEDDLITYKITIPEDDDA